MPRNPALLAFALSALALAGCDKANAPAGPGGVTVSEAQALDEAAEMLDQRRTPAEAPRPSSPAPTPAPSAAP